jgi:hypothetical protein
MSSQKVADFAAFLSVTVEGEALFETREGRVVVTHKELVVAGEGETQRFPLDAIRAFDFRTVPGGWEQFFDDLVGVQLDSEGGETIVTVGADTGIADQFVTVLLKLLLDGSSVGVDQQRFPLGTDSENQHTEETTVTLRPGEECLTFEGETLGRIDLSTITGVDCDGETVTVQHLYGGGRVTTTLHPETSRDRQFFETYLDFRSELLGNAGPAQFLFVGEDKDTLVLTAKLLKHREFAFEAGHVQSLEETLDALDETERTMECFVVEDALPETSPREFRDALSEAGHDAPLIYLADTTSEDASLDGAQDVVALGSRTDHYEDIADAIERAVIAGRLG